jgi:predicted dehydrogenase
MTKALVIGYGSIGRRHARILAELGCEVAVVSRRPLDEGRRFADIAEAVTTMQPDYAVIANETSAHVAAADALAAAGFSGELLVEKPLGGAVANGAGFARCAVAYNLRFHPAVIRLAELLRGETIVAIQVYCGQYLPDWRPGTDYRTSYSADPARGGGVLRDLSHELDLLLLLAGPWRRVAALGGRFGALDIASDECWALLVELERCPCATLQVNYLDRPGRREIVVNTADHTYRVDFGRAALISDGEVEEFAADRDATYRAQHRAMMAGDTAHLCSLDEGTRVMGLIAAAERAAGAQEWVAA